MGLGSVKEFLGLSEADAILIEMKLALSRSLRDRRKETWPVTSPAR